MDVDSDLKLHQNSRFSGQRQIRQDRRRGTAEFDCATDIQLAGKRALRAQLKSVYMAKIVLRLIEIRQKAEQKLRGF
jgi:hypothetical protein